MVLVVVLVMVVVVGWEGGIDGVGGGRVGG